MILSTLLALSFTATSVLADPPAEAPKTPEVCENLLSDKVQALVQDINDMPHRYRHELREIGYDNFHEITMQAPEVAARIILNEWTETNLEHQSKGKKTKHLVKNADANSAITVYLSIKKKDPKSIAFNFSEKAATELKISNSYSYSKDLSEGGFLATLELPLAVLYRFGESGLGYHELTLSTEDLQQDGNVDLRPFIVAIENTKTKEEWTLREFDVLVSKNLQVPSPSGSVIEFKPLRK